MHFFALSLGKIFSHTWEFLLRLIVANEVLAVASDHRSSDASLPSKLRFVAFEITFRWSRDYGYLLDSLRLFL